jgi:hypothetical protein
VPDPSFSSLYVVPDFPSMLFSYLITTSLTLPLLFLRLYSVVWRIMLIVPVVGGEVSAHSCNSCRLSCLEVTRGLWENGGNHLYNVGATQPIGIFLPPPSRKSMQLCRFGSLPPFRHSTQLCGFDICNAFRHGPCNGSPPFPAASPPPSFPLHPSFPSLIGRMVCWHRMCCVPLMH